MWSLLFLLWIFIFIQPTTEVLYSCNSTAPCGCSTASASVNKIIGGETASTNTWGWAVSLYIDEQWICGGTMLSSSWILTAGHCAVGATPKSVFISAASNQLLGAKQWRYASAVFTHPQYDSELLENDIALIKVSPPFDMKDRAISKICLPVPTQEDYPPINSTLVLIGWGSTVDNGSVSETLQQVTLQRVGYDADTCNPIISNDLNQICAGVPAGDKNSCSGDSGGALMMFTPSHQWAVVGIVSYGALECADPNYTGVYTRVSYFLDWITSIGVSDAVYAVAFVLMTSAQCNEQMLLVNNYGIIRHRRMMNPLFVRRNAPSGEDNQDIYVRRNCCFTCKSTCWCCYA